MMYSFDCDDIRQMLDADATLLDVRTTDEHRIGRLPFAKNIPLVILPLLAHEHMAKEKQVLIYCRSAGRAVIAEKILSSLDFSDVTNIGSIVNFQHCH